MSAVSEELYVEMQRNHIAYENELKERIAELERERDELAILCEIVWGEDVPNNKAAKAIARRDLLVSAEALMGAAHDFNKDAADNNDEGRQESASICLSVAMDLERKSNRLRREADELNGEQA